MGGCLAHYKKNLVNENYYPYSGKAYAEDLIHSHILKSRGCTLILDTTARCGIEKNTARDLGMREYLKELFADYKARRFFAKLSRKSIFRLNLFYLAQLMNHLIRATKRFVVRPFASH